MQKPSTSTPPATTASSPARPESKAPLSTRVPMTAQEASLSSVFDACIPGNMLMYPTCPRDASPQDRKT